MTLAEEVVDASVLGAAFFNETASDTARAWLIDGPRLIAPDLIHMEIASIAAKKVWRGEVTIKGGARSLDAVEEFVAETVSMRDLARQAFSLAAEHRFSAYDAAYLALAEARGTRVVTLDGRLADRAKQVGLGHLIRGLEA